MAVPLESIEPGKCYLMDTGQLRRVGRVMPNGQIQYEHRPPRQGSAKTWKPGRQGARSARRPGVRVRPTGQIQYEPRPPRQGSAKTWKPGMQSARSFADLVEREVPCDW